MTPTSQITVIAGRYSSQTPFICLQCRRRASTAARRVTLRLHTFFPPRRSASSTRLERIRSRIWGTDAPPGQVDPYGAPGTFEQQRSQRLARKDEDGPPAKDIPREPSIIEQAEGAPASGGEDAMTWEGMRVVGGADYGLKEWDREHPFKGYMENARAQHRDVIVSIIHRALVEVMTLRKANLPLVLRRDPYEATYDYNPAKDYEHYKYRIAQGAKFRRSDNGEMTLKLEDEELARIILERIVPKGTVLERIIPKDATAVEQDGQVGTATEGGYLDEEQELEADEKEEEEEDIAATSTEEQGELELASPEEPEVSDPSTDEEPQTETLDVQPRARVSANGRWRSVSLADPDFKFAVIKRVMQLTGRRIPDPDIAGIKTSRGLFTHLMMKKPRTKKLVQILRADEAVDLPNVELYGRRYTPVHKEKEIGRWKVIEQELNTRGLPVTGKGYGRSGPSDCLSIDR